MPGLVNESVSQLCDGLFDATVIHLFDLALSVEAEGHNQRMDETAKIYLLLQSYMLKCYF